MRNIDRPRCPKRINLTPEEDVLFKNADGDPSAAELLMRSLVERDAIPSIRWQYFVDPELNIGHRYSHKEQFERNGTRGDAILRHPHFLPYLRYIVCGPDLPREVIERFHQKVLKEPYVSSGDVEGLCDLARALTREFDLDPRTAAEEFHKLALECFGVMHEDEYDLGGYEGYARIVRDHVKKTTRTRR